MSTRLAEQWGVPTIALAALLLALVGLTHLLLRWWVRRQSRRYEAGARWVSVDEARWRRWLTRALHEMLPPAALLVWIQGITFALDLAVRDSAPVTVRETALDRPGLGLWIQCCWRLFWLLWRLGGIIELFLASLSARADTSWDDLLLPLAGKTVRRALPLLAVILGAPALSVSPALAEVVRNATSLMLIGVVAFILCQVVDAAAAFVLKQHRTDVADNLQARAIHTQVLVLKKVALTVIGVFTLASMLMVFESVRQFGASILASAGVAGIVVGLAAQRSIATLLAGFPDRTDAADSCRRRGHRRERVGSHRGHHADVCRRANLGPATLDCADDALHRATVPELDAFIFGHPLHRHVPFGLLRASDSDARRTHAHFAAVTILGRPRQCPPGH